MDTNMSDMTSPGEEDIEGPAYLGHNASSWGCIFACHIDPPPQCSLLVVPDVIRRLNAADISDFSSSSTSSREFQDISSRHQVFVWPPPSSSKRVQTYRYLGAARPF